MGTSTKIGSIVLSLTRHFEERLRQRGVHPRLVQLVLAHGDILLHGGDGCEIQGLSHKAALSLIAEGHSADEVMRAARLRLITADDRAVTVHRHLHGKAGRRYRRQGVTHKWSRQARRSSRRQARSRPMRLRSV